VLIACDHSPQEQYRHEFQQENNTDGYQLRIVGGSRVNTDKHSTVVNTYLPTNTASTTTASVLAVGV
jgi:hypothetical protein